MGFKSKFSLRRAVASICARNRDVRVHDVTAKTFVWRVVLGEAAKTRDGLNGVAVGAVWAGVADDVKVLGDQLSFAIDNGCECQRLRVPGSACDEFL